MVRFPFYRASVLNQFFDIRLTLVREIPSSIDSLRADTPFFRRKRLFTFLIFSLVLTIRGPPCAPGSSIDPVRRSITILVLRKYNVLQVFPFHFLKTCQYYQNRFEIYKFVELDTGNLFKRNSPIG
jgi:hypothetical protein